MKTGSGRGASALAAFALAVAGLALSGAPAGAAASEIGRLFATKPTAVAVDAALSKMYVAEQDGLLRIYDTRTYASTSVELTCCLAALIADPDTHRVYASGNGLLVLDGITGAVLSTVSLAPGTPDGLALDAAGGRVFAANPPGDTVAVLDTATNQIAATIPAGDRPVAVAFDRSSGVLFVSNAGDQTVQAIDPVGPTVLATAAVATPSALTVADGKLYVASDGVVRVLDAATLADDGAIVVGSSPRALAYNPVARRLWVSNWGSGTVSFIDTTTRTVLGTMPSGTRPLGAVFDPGLGRTYVAVHGSNEVQLLHDVSASLMILSPGQGAMVGPSKRIVTGRAPPGSPVTLFEGATAVGGGLADLSGEFAISTFLGEGTHTIVAAVPYEPYSPPRTFTVDLTPPSMALDSRTPAAPSGWNRTAVRVVWRCTDALAGVKSEQIEKILPFDGRDQTTSGTCEDKAGNTTIATQTGISIDQRAPVIGMLRTPVALAGWNRTSPVTVSFTCVDTLSGLAGPASYSQQVSGQTSGRSVTFQCADVAGNITARTETVRIDQTAPTATVNLPLLPVVARVPHELTRVVTLGLEGSAHDGLSMPSGVEVRMVDEAGSEWFMDAPCIAGCGEATIRWRVRPPPSLEPGWYAVSARSTDVAGNRGDWSAAAQILIVSPDDVPLPRLPPIPIG